MIANHLMMPVMPLCGRRRVFNTIHGMGEASDEDLFFFFAGETVIVVVQTRVEALKYFVSGSTILL